MRKTHYILLNVIFTLLTSLPAQGQQMTGKIANQSNNEAIEFANIVALTPDSVFIDGTVSKSDGTFSLSLPTDGQKRMVRISYIGYEDTVIPFQTGNIGTVWLAPKTQMLQETVITARRPLFKVTATGIETDVSKSVLSTMQDANEVLKFLPGVSGDGGNFNVFGKGKAEIYLNGRKVNDPMLLSMLQGKDIQTVEVVHNPGARYKQTTGAVILIKTKKKVGEGWSGSITNNYKRSQMNSYASSANLTYRKKRLELSGSLSYGNTEQQIEQNYEKTILGKHKQIGDSEMDKRIKSLYGSYGMVYDFNNKHSIGIRYAASKGKIKTLMDQAIDVMQEDILSEQLAYQTKYVNNNPSHQLSSYYLGQFGKWGISFDFDLYATKTDVNQYTSEFNDENSLQQKVTSFNRQKSRLYAAKLLFSRPLGKGNVNFGSEYSFTKNTNVFYNQEGLLTNTDDRVETNNIAAFAEYAVRLKNWNFYAGLRYETTLSDYYEAGELIKEQSKDYHDLFPTLNISGKAGPVQLFLGYAMRKRSPSYYQLNSYIQYNDRYSYESGNPLLQPSITHNLNLTVDFAFVQLQTYFISQNDVMMRTDRPYGEDAILYTYENFKNVKNLGAMLILSPKMNFWQPLYSFGVTKQYIDEHALGIDRNLGKPYFQMRLSNVFTLPWDMSVQTIYNYISAGNSQTNYEKPFSSLYVGLSKYFLKKKLLVRVFANDIFKTAENRSTYYGRHIQTRRNVYNDYRSIAVSIQYRFNTGKSRYKGTGAGKTERERLQNQ